MHTPVVTEIVKQRPQPRINKPIALSPAVTEHERSVYDADPTGGSASRY